MAVSRRKRLVNTVEANRQKQLYRLMERYTAMIYKPGALTHLYSWNVAYITAATLGPTFIEFHCYTNNVAFAAMLFEAHKLPEVIIINYMEFNYLVQ